MSVCRNSRGVRYRLPLPGNPISDHIGEGKPENQNNAFPYLFARTVQTLDMNQEAYFEVSEGSGATVIYRRYLITYMHKHGSGWRMYIRSTFTCGVGMRARTHARNQNTHGGIHLHSLTSVCVLDCSRCLAGVSQATKCAGHVAGETHVGPPGGGARHAGARV